MNVIVLTGRIGDRIELKNYGQGKEFLTFSLAVNRPYKVNGEVITDWFNCHSFNDNLVKNVSKWLNKGDRISVQGSVEVNKNDNNTYYNVNVSQITLLETKAEKENKEQHNQQRQNNNKNYYEAPKGNIDLTSDLPF